MQLTSLQYGGFLVVVLAIYWNLPKRWRPHLLLVASYVFYATWSLPAVALLALATLTSWSTARAIPGAPDARKRLLMGMAVLVSIGVLSLYKVVDLISGGGGLGSTSRWAIPVGLSFFTFQAISYVVDVYRGDTEARRSLVDVALYIAFFPHLLAGPIVRASKLIPAFHDVPVRPDTVQWSEAAELILVGVFKKVVLADPITSNIATLAIHRDILSSVNVAVALIGGVIAAYFNITAYVDIARGSAKLLGIDMQRNSLSPLLKSTGYADFWRRWQLTVMMWFRDYVFKPLRGDGRSEGREIFALFGTFAVLGAWHGLSPGWLLWGALSGAIIVGERTIQARGSAKRRAALRAARRAGRKPVKPRRMPQWARLAITYVLVFLTLPLISTSQLSEAFHTYSVFTTWRGGKIDRDLLWLTAFAIVALVLLDHREQRREDHTGRSEPLTYARAASYGIAVTAIVVFSGTAAQPFLYFRF
jgi:D-alanyl-lipoteichoic acid acyltransferase DltB (MBOAT superfamily)